MKDTVFGKKTPILRAKAVITGGNEFIKKLFEKN